jgi:hypothetical protein
MRSADALRVFITLGELPELESGLAHGQAGPSVKQLVGGHRRAADRRDSDG